MERMKDKDKKDAGLKAREEGTEGKEGRSETGGTKKKGIVREGGTEA